MGRRFADCTAGVQHPSTRNELKLANKACDLHSAKVLPTRCKRVALDIGTNIGTDSLFYLKHGMCVVGVDALPQMSNKTAQLTREYSNSISLLNAGLAESDGGCLRVFTPKRRTIWATLDYSKAMSYVRTPRQIIVSTVPSVPCERLWTFVPPGVRPLLMKIDIEERHYLCVEALERVAPSVRPVYVSWEQHFGYARNLSFPLLDVRLMLLMSSCC